MESKSLLFFILWLFAASFLNKNMVRSQMNNTTFDETIKKMLTEDKDVVKRKALSGC